ncbi:unnamed protein product [Cuscuta campestris]|uniref:Uncharacterized protein n=1 Tax=Cuscuta campestris TaxID=132261 RepID=A0A484LDT9_9ASTE|nr:unnamed protein product [Cuscuta campestris]
MHNEHLSLHICLSMQMSTFEGMKLGGIYFMGRHIFLVFRHLLLILKQVFMDFLQRSLTLDNMANQSQSH